MRGSEKPDPGAGPLSTISQVYVANVERVTKVYEPALKGAGRYNLELFTLAAQRAQAWFDVPKRLGQCKTPQDLLGEQMQFWQTAAAQYTASWHRLGAAFGASLAQAGAEGTAVAQKHDFITVPEASGQPDQVAQDEPKRGDRRAA